MLDTFFTQIKVRSRMESGPIGPYLSEIAAVLHRNGYARSTIRRHLRAADRFGAWILKEGMSIVDINASTGWIAGQAAARFKPDDALLAFLASL
jgi:hypothetical protein